MNDGKQHSDAIRHQGELAVGRAELCPVKHRRLTWNYGL